MDRDMNCVGACNYQNSLNCTFNICAFQYLAMSQLEKVLKSKLEKNFELC